MTTHLLGVLLAEVGDVGSDHAQQLGHDRADPRKCAAPRTSPSKRSVTPRTSTEVANPAGYTSSADGANSKSAPARSASARSSRLAAGIALQVGALVELGRVDEQRDDDDVALLAGAFDQRQMTLVQRAHRRHEADRAPGAALGRERRAQLGDGAHDPHARGEGRRLTSWLIGFGPVPYGYRRD